MQESVKMFDRRALHNANAFKLGLFGANCSSGRSATLVEERWSGSWADNLRLALLAEERGLDFLLPIARWKGFGGQTDFQGTTLETLTWAAALLAATERVTVFGTVHAPLIHPVIAAKQMVTADHIGHGRFGLNVVCGWNEGEFEMFDAKPGDHDARYRHGQEWLETIKEIWSRDDFDVDGEFHHFKGVRVKPKPFRETRPIIMNAGSSPQGKAFALRNCDAFFTYANLSSLEQMAAGVREMTATARSHGNEIGFYTVGVVVCRPTHAEAEAYHRHCFVENADWDAVDSLMQLHGQTPDTMPAEQYQRLRAETATRGGFPLTGTPDEIAERLALLHQVGFTGIGVSFVNYLEELPYFCDEVLPRLEARGLRATLS